jgi:hypothetical protein
MGDWSLRVGPEDRPGAADEPPPRAPSCGPLGPEYVADVWKSGVRRRPRSQFRRLRRKFCADAAMVLPLAAGFFAVMLLVELYLTQHVVAVYGTPREADPHASSEPSAPARYAFPIVAIKQIGALAR